MMPEKKERLINDQPFSESRKITMAPADHVVLETPGGGGYGARQ